MRTAGSGIAPCRGRRHRPGPGTARYCHSPALQLNQPPQVNFRYTYSIQREKGIILPVIMGTLLP